MSTYYLYWLYEPNHTDILTEGYIGITNNAQRRLKQHYRTKGLVGKVLLIGSKQYCLEVEYKLRPTSNIGHGGSNQPKTEEHRRKIGLAHKGRKAPWTSEWNKIHKIGNKNRLGGTLSEEAKRQIGLKNSINSKGKKHSEESIQKMRNSPNSGRFQKGQMPWNKKAA